MPYRAARMEKEMDGYVQADPGASPSRGSRKRDQARTLQPRFFSSATHTQTHGDSRRGACDL